MRILVVEDQKDLNEIIVRKLKDEHFSVDFCYSADDAKDFLACAQYSGIVLDIMLPGSLTGLGLLKEMRAAGDTTPVLLLTALGTVSDRVSGLNAGADDYLAKPFDFEELIARIRAITRRGSGSASATLESGDLALDTETRTVTRGGVEIELQGKEFDILEYMMLNEGKVLSRDKISNHIWNYDYCGGSNAIDVYIHHIRKKVDGSSEDKKIVTVKGVGYKLI